MSFSTLIAPTTVSLQPISLLPASSYEKDIEADVRDFWSSFPCPPPWKPHLLVEVNASRLDPHVSKTVRSFLAGKCDIRNVLSSSEYDNFDLGDISPDLDLRPTDVPDSRSSLGDPETSHQKWCDSTCQMAFGCALFFVVAVMMVSLIICVNKHRVRHKMAATRPSRQQLQLSTSTSDAANCTEFSNLQIQGEDVFYPPFRHRGLPQPPRLCHPSCDPNWNCPNCSPCHPLMRPSPSDQYYSHTYSAVYETIDDMDEDEVEVQQTDNEMEQQSRDITPVRSELVDQQKSCVPCHISSSCVSSVKLQSPPGEAKKDTLKTAETGFNGDGHSAKTLKPKLPNYFELENSCALSRPYEAIIQNSELMNSSGVSDVTSVYHKPVVTNCGHCQILPMPCKDPMFGDTSSHSFVVTQAQNNSAVSANEICMPQSETESGTGHINEGTNKKHPMISDVQSVICTRGCSGSSDILLHDGYRTSYTNGQIDPNRQQKQGRQEVRNYNTSSAHVCKTVSSFFPNIPSHYFCPTCQQDNAARVANAHRMTSTAQELNSRPTFVDGCIAPDLLNEASNHVWRREQETTHSNRERNDNPEVPSDKSTLALHSHYFGKSSTN